MTTSIFLWDNPYQKDAKTKFAVERNLEIIGEAINNVLKLAPDISISSARKIVDMRNRLIHAYDAVDDYVIWAVINTHLPQLKIEIDALFNG